MSGQKIVIDKSKCNGCGLCVNACHEGALGLVDGKAELIREDYCDGMGDCLPACPQGAITFEEKKGPAMIPNIPMSAHTPMGLMEGDVQWPLQLALVPSQAPYFKGKLVVAADCTAFAMDDFRGRFIDGNPVVIGCPKLDDRVRFDKLVSIIRDNPIHTIEVVRMEVPCCSALTRITNVAIEMSGRSVPVKEVIVSRSGKILSR